MSSRSSRPVAAVTTTTVSPGSMVSRPPGVMIRPSRLMAPISRFGRVGSSMSGLPQTADFSVARNIPLHRGTLKCTLEVNNLFNQQYEVVMSYPMPGTNVKAIVQYAF